MINDFMKYSNSMDFHFACLKAMATTDVNTPASNPQPRQRVCHHCIVTKLMEVKSSIFDQCKDHLRNTPFGWLLNLHFHIEANGRILEVMFANWNAEECAFKVGDKLIPFTLYDVALILGLPMMGGSIDCSKYYGKGLVEHCCSKK